MTFCVAMKIADGLVGIADTRITSGVEHHVARKLTIHQHDNHSLFIMTSGLRSVRDKALTYFNEVVEERDEKFHKLYQAVNAFAEQVRRVAKEDKKALAQAGYSFNLSTLVGGQLERDAEPKLFLLYPQGNWVEVSEATPYFIIGESAYGKPLLDRSFSYTTPMDKALQLAYLAFDAVRVSATDVGFPLDMFLYRAGSYRIVHHRYEYDDLIHVSRWWQEALRTTSEKAPSEWMRSILEKLPTAE